MLDLIIVSGGSKGIGRSIVEKCSGICEKMIVIGSSEEVNNIKVKNLNCEIIPLRLDLEDYNNVYEVVREKVNGIEIENVGVVLCGAQIGMSGGVFNTDLDGWDKLYKINVLGNLSIVKACEEKFKNGVKGKVIFFGGGGAAFSYPDFSGYALSKVSIVRAAENLAEECKKLNYNVETICISPGAVMTDILKVVIENGGEIRTKTDISEPTEFVFNYLNGDFDKFDLNGRFIHVRDNLEEIDFDNKNMRKLRRIE